MHPLMRKQDLVPTPTTPPARREDALHYVDPYVEPSTLPAMRHLVEETYLPYVLTQGDDGQWSKVDNGWSIFGRQAGPTNAVLVDNEGQTVASSVPSTTWAVEENLPTGWGQSSNRTDFYKVPLISVASVILAFAIVTGIIIIAFKRRKAVRRAKRRAERQRRKALAAAGLTETDINSNTANAAMAEKLQSLETQHRGKRRKFGSTALVRTKVKNWNQSLRRRKGKKGDGDGDEDGGRMEVVQEEGGDQESVDKPVEPAGAPELAGNARSSEDSAGSATDPPSEGSGSGSGSDSRLDSSVTASTASEAVHPPTTGTTAYFPPAYRPASVRSLRITPSTGSSSHSSLTHDAPPPTATEKTSAPGYYPAPTTVDTEEAIAVVSRSQGKSRAIVDEEEEARAERMRHVATDDKRVLEQLRLGASAPSAPSPSGMYADEGDAGPSAPHFDVDEQGFERLALEEAGPSAPPEPIATASVPSGVLPAPPPRVQLRSMRSGTVSEVTPLDEATILPSAPPVIGTDYAHAADSVPSAPSAPPMLDDEEADSEGHSSATAPSAPPLAPEEEDEESSEQATAPRSSSDSTTSARRIYSRDGDRGQQGGEGEEEGQGGDAEQDDQFQRTERESSRSSAHPGVVFLPRYEP